MNFQMLFPGKIIFQDGVSHNLGTIIKNKFNKPLILSGGISRRDGDNYEKIITSLKSQKIKYVEYTGISGEPTPQIVDEVTDFVVEHDVKTIIALGGGSVIDTGKAVAALAVNERGVEKYLEGVGKGAKVKNDPLPFIAMPTTAGSGAEVTKNSVITSRKKKYKKSFRDERLIAKIVLADPLLTVSLPTKQTAYGGMDAICQLIESMVSKKANLYCQSFSAFFIPKAINAIIEAYENPVSIDARSIMLAASIASGIALASSGLGAVHGFASGLGGMYDVPHGLICGLLLPGVCEKNCSKDPLKYREVARFINDDNSGDIIKFIDKLYSVNEKLGIPHNFKQFNIPIESADEIVERSQGSSMSGNPVDFSTREWSEFIKAYL